MTENDRRVETPAHEGQNTGLWQSVKGVGLLLWMLSAGLLLDVAHGIWHTARCETIADSWRWEQHEVEIGESSYEVDRCARCHYKRRVRAADLKI